VPEELILPYFEVICFVEEGQDAREHSNAIESMFLGCKIQVGERWKMSKGRKAIGESCDEGFKVP